jgi:hypothetical protein
MPIIGTSLQRMGGYSGNVIHDQDEREYEARINQPESDDDRRERNLAALNIGVEDWLDIMAAKRNAAETTEAAND